MPIVTPASEINLAVAGMLRDYADLLQEQGEDGFRWRACRQAADVVAELPRSVDCLSH
ncbi:helix-hairpin-helix domain-containing protein [Mesorhizobium sp. KR9-304]|uniref:helix-hairpin-helix domain-containing protein n=1 Tax=Mesorhizobium sp. KR9-304 TaxID=3156614 RepID=UPI0032B3437B